MPHHKKVGRVAGGFRGSSFGFRSSFFIRASSFFRSAAPNCAVYGAALCAFLILTASAAAADAPSPPVVTAIYPTATVLPANHLKFYIHFSEPMRQGVFLDHCKLLDDQDREVLEPFRETELWSADCMRLTLWLHPGRQKTGVNLNTEFGAVLEPGRRYTLVIAGAWPAERGAGIPCHDARKSFFAAPRATAFY